MSYEQKLKTLQDNFKERMERTNGVVSKSMNVNTKPSHRFYYNGYLVTIDGNMPEQEFLKIKELIKTTK